MRAEEAVRRAGRPAVSGLHLSGSESLRHRARPAVSVTRGRRLQNGNIGAADKQLNRLLQTVAIRRLAGRGARLRRARQARSRAGADAIRSSHHPATGLRVCAGGEGAGARRAGDGPSSAIGAFEAAQSARPALNLSARIEALRFPRCRRIDSARPRRRRGRAGTRRRRVAYTQALSCVARQPAAAARAGPDRATHRRARSGPGAPREGRAGRSSRSRHAGGARRTLRVAGRLRLAPLAPTMPRRRLR
jgi:hypothetical protein